MIELDALRHMLGFGPTEGEAWFVLPESIVGFAPQKPDSLRAIILGAWGTGQMAVVFPRSRSDQRQKEHLNPAHVHHDDFPDCWLKDQAWVVLSRPIRVSKDELRDDSRLCTEDDPATIAAVQAVP